MTQDERRAMMAARKAGTPNEPVSPNLGQDVAPDLKENENNKPVKTKTKDKKTNAESVKVSKYYGPATVSHLIVFLVTLILVAAMVVPYIPYVVLDGDNPLNFQPMLVGIPSLLGQTLGWTVPKFFEPNVGSYAYTYLIAHMLQITDAKLSCYVTTAIYGVGLIFIAVPMIYSFICLVGGIGRKQAYKLAYVALAGGLLIYLIPFATMIYDYIQVGTISHYPFPSIVAIVLLIIMVVTAHVLYAKRIKYTVTDKELEKYAGKASNKEEVSETSEPNPEFDELMKDFEKLNNEPKEVQKEATPVVTPVVAPVELVKEESKIEEVEAEPKVEPIKPSKAKTTVTYQASSGLPEGIKELGDHQFSKNLDLEVAIIPEGIDKIGPACFANCLNLKAVSIPTSVKKISFNAFFACKKLTKINYAGTKVEWKNIARGSNWLTSAGTKVVICKDGAISVNPFH